MRGPIIPDQGSGTSLDVQPASRPSPRGMTGLFAAGVLRSSLVGGRVWPQLAAA